MFYGRQCYHGNYDHLVSGQTATDTKGHVTNRDVLGGFAPAPPLLGGEKYTNIQCEKNKLMFG